jgi:predicted nucleic acid-binding Zn ribbon protein
VGTTDQPDPAASGSAPDDGTPEPHDPTGLGLAQTVARSLAGRRGVPGRRTSQRRGGAPRPIGPGPQVSGSHPDERDPQLLSTAMERLVDSKGWTAQVDVRSMLARWSTLVGPVNAAHSHPESYTDTVLTVRADSTAWATQLRLLAPRLVATLNTALGDGTVTRVTVLGPDAPSWKRGRLSVRDGRGPRDTYG